jgi:hypothetical protein
MASPRASEIETTLTETASESRAPHSRRESVSRPNSSVPAQWAAEGPSSRCSRSIAAGLCGASQGAASPAQHKAGEQQDAYCGQRLAANAACLRGVTRS